MAEIDETGKWCPVFEKDGNEFIVPIPGWYGETESQGQMMAFAMLPETVLWGCKWTHRVVNTGNGILHREATIQGTSVAIISGPLFEAI